MIKFKTQKCRPAYSEESTVQRIAEIICGLRYAPDVPYKKENGTWVLDVGNDWFLRLKQDDDTDEYRHWELEYRYEGEKLTQALEGLKLFLEYALGDK